MSVGPSALLFQYRLLMALVFPLLATHAAWIALRHRNARYLRERLGFFASVSECDLWIHAASVGEVNAVLPLLRLLRARHPERRILVTTATVTGAATLQAKLPELPHCFLPLDRTGGVRRFLAALRPRCALITETELWPNLYAACAERKVPLVIINGRISARTLGAPVWVRDLYEECLATVTAVLARSEADRLHFIELGAPGERVEVTGNIKFAAAPQRDQIQPIHLGRPYVLAASTREGEERLLVEAWEQAGIRDHLLVIAPRHPQRLAEIVRDVAGRPVAVRSRGEAIVEGVNYYIADTFGELPAFMAGAELVFMGGSLVPRGGQNLLEPAALAKAIITGPYMENFAQETELLRHENALVQVKDTAELRQTFKTLLADAPGRENLGRNARAVVDARRNMAERYADAIERICR